MEPSKHGIDFLVGAPLNGVDNVQHSSVRAACDDDNPFGRIDGESNFLVKIVRDVLVHILDEHVGLVQNLLRDQEVGVDCHILGELAGIPSHVVDFDSPCSQCFLVELDGNAEEALRAIGKVKLPAYAILVVLVVGVLKEIRTDEELFIEDAEFVVVGKDAAAVIIVGVAEHHNIHVLQIETHLLSVGQHTARLRRVEDHPLIPVLDQRGKTELIDQTWIDVVAVLRQNRNLQLGKRRNSKDKNQQKCREGNRVLLQNKHILKLRSRSSYKERKT